jgi:hypothetical protein
MPPPYDLAAGSSSRTMYRPLGRCADAGLAVAVVAPTSPVTPRARAVAATATVLDRRWKDADTQWSFLGADV